MENCKRVLKWLMILAMFFLIFIAYYCHIYNITVNSYILKIVKNGTLFNFNLKPGVFNKVKKNGTILLWTKVFTITSQHVSCGQYNCEVITDRRKMKISDIIVFNARYARGMRD